MNAKHGRDQHKIAQGRCSGISLRTPKQAKSYIMACIAKIHMGRVLKENLKWKKNRFWVGVKWCETWDWCWMARSSFVFHCLSIHALEIFRGYHPQCHRPLQKQLGETSLPADRSDLVLLRAGCKRLPHASSTHCAAGVHHRVLARMPQHDVFF